MESKLSSERNSKYGTKSSSECYSMKAVTSPIQHGEGPHWDEKNQVLYYVDTFTATIHRWNPENESASSHKLENHNSVGIIVPIKNEKNQFVVGADRHLYRFQWPAECVKSKPEAAILAHLDAEKPKNQFNDGKADSRGRIWIGTLTRNEDLSVSPKGGSLFMVKCGELTREDEKISDTSISNGIAWSKDNRKFYFIDSRERNVAEFDYEEESGKISNKRIVFDLSSHPDIKGFPDGMTIDDQDNLWIALFGGGSVINVDPKSGKLIKIVQMPVTYITSVCFGGPKLDVLFATTSKLHLKEKQQAEEPQAGSVFAIENLGVKGLPSHEAVFQ